MDFEVDIDLDEFKQHIKSEKHTLLKNTERFAEAVAVSIVNHARSTGGYGTQPGAARTKAGTYIPRDERSPRPAHPGGWADITGNLANSIKGKVETHGYSVHIVVQATMEYAAALDAKTGYDVLGGADQLARQYIKKHEHILFD